MVIALARAIWTCTAHRGGIQACGSSGECPHLQTHNRNRKHMRNTKKEATGRTTSGANGDRGAPEITASLSDPCSSRAMRSASSISSVPKPCNKRNVVVGNKKRTRTQAMTNGQRKRDHGTEHTSAQGARPDVGISWDRDCERVLPCLPSQHTSNTEKNKRRQQTQMES